MLIIIYKSVSKLSYNRLSNLFSKVSIKRPNHNFEFKIPNMSKDAERLLIT